MTYSVTLDGITFNDTDFTNYGMHTLITVNGQSYPRWIGFWVAGLREVDARVTAIGNKLTTTSSTSNSVGTGSKTFTVGSSLYFAAGQPVRVARTADLANTWMDGVVASYSGTTLAVTVNGISGSGTYTDWTINIGGGGAAPSSPMSIAQGGTGGATQDAALAALGLVETFGRPTGLILTRASATTISVATGAVLDAGGTNIMRLAAALTKSTSSWAVGSGNGGLDTGSWTSGTLYAVWLIKRTDTGVVDALLSASFTSPTMPTNYTVKRLIGAVYASSGTDILNFTQVGDYFRYTGDVIEDVADTTITSLSYETATLSVPPNAIAHIYGAVTSTGTDQDGYILIRTAGAADADGSGAAQLREAFHAVDAGGAFERLTGIGMVMVNSSRQVNYAAYEPSGVTELYIKTLGFWMPSRSNP